MMRALTRLPRVTGLLVTHRMTLTQIPLSSVTRLTRNHLRSAILFRKPSQQLCESLRHQSSANERKPRILSSMQPGMSNLRPTQSAQLKAGWENLRRAQEQHIQRCKDFQHGAEKILSKAQKVVDVQSELTGVVLELAKKEAAKQQRRKLIFETICNVCLALGVFTILVDTFGYNGGKGKSSTTQGNPSPKTNTPESPLKTQPPRSWFWKNGNEPNPK